MTGHGEGHAETDDLSVSVELRSINSRYMKLSLRAPEGYNAFESQMESVVKKGLKRGSIQLNLRIHKTASPDDYALNQAVVQKYIQDLQAICKQLDTPQTVSISDVLNLPGVVADDAENLIDADTEWPVIESALSQAVQTLNAMRADEGQNMADDLKANCQTIESELTEIEALAGKVVEAYQTRLTDRVNKLLENFDVTIGPADVVREIGLFTERADISEETVRLRSHLKQFDSIMGGNESNGRKLEFLTQEMFRETNTIGSKANDAQIANHVIEIKAAIERMREMIQNVE